MLFATKLQSVNDNLVNLADEINTDGLNCAIVWRNRVLELEQRLEQLREEKKQLENFAQHLQSAEAAAESALQQLNTAVKMVRAVDENELANFKEAVDSVFSLKIEYLAEKSDPIPVVEIALENEDARLEVSSSPPPFEGKQVVREGSIALTPEELDKKFSFAQLKRIAEAMNIKPTGRKKIDYACAISEEGMTVEAAQEILRK